jgi:ADP-heptose:LPS heptosyltransferase
VAAEGERIRQECPELLALPHVEDITGRYGLAEFIDFLGTCHGILACSTGPLHIGAALGKYALGLFPPLKPMHPGRWAPLGTHAANLVMERACKLCKRGGDCICLADILPSGVTQLIEAWEERLWE